VVGTSKCIVPVLRQQAILCELARVVVLRERSSVVPPTKSRAQVRSGGMQQVGAWRLFLPTDELLDREEPAAGAIGPERTSTRAEIVVGTRETASDRGFERESR